MKWFKKSINLYIGIQLFKEQIILSIKLSFQKNILSYVQERDPLSEYNAHITVIK